MAKSHHLEPMDDRNVMQWICCGCAIAAGDKMRPGHVATWHIGSPCGRCLRVDVPVTEPRDFRR